MHRRVHVRDLSVRRLGPHVPSIIVALGAAVVVAVMGLGFAPLQGVAMFDGMTGWQELTGSQTLRVLGAGAFLIVGYLCAVTAMRFGDIGVVAPFRYTSLLWAILLGFAAFGNLPDGWTLLGAAIVVGSGIYTLLRERKLRRGAAAG